MQEQLMKDSSWFLLFYSVGKKDIQADWVLLQPNFLVVISLLHDCPYPKKKQVLITWCWSIILGLTEKLRVLLGVIIFLVLDNVFMLVFYHCRIKRAYYHTVNWGGECSVIFNSLVIFGKCGMLERSRFNFALCPVIM